ncbi:hypothetical protein ACFL5X_01135 [Candidatus Omnitrophota bacterium]
MNKKQFFFLIFAIGLIFLSTLDFWFPSKDKTLVAIYDDASKGYNIFYEFDGKINPEPTWLVKAFSPLNELYITDFEKNNWRLVIEQIQSIKENNPSGRAESVLLEEILDKHNKGFYPENIGYEVTPSAMKKLRIWFDKNILKKK